MWRGLPARRAAVADFRLPRDNGVRFPDRAAFVAGPFQAFVCHLRPKLFQRLRCRLVRMPFGVVRNPRHFKASKPAFTLRRDQGRRRDDLDRGNCKKGHRASSKSPYDGRRPGAVIAVFSLLHRDADFDGWRVWSIPKFCPATTSNKPAAIDPTRVIDSFRFWFLDLHRQA